MFPSAHSITPPIVSEDVFRLATNSLIRPHCSGLRQNRVEKEAATPLIATESVFRLWGGTQSQLMRGCDNKLWVVKFKNNPQSSRILVNELIGTLLADAIGLSVPVAAVIDVGQQLIDQAPRMFVDHGKYIEKCEAGLQFASLYVGRSVALRKTDSASDRDLLRSAHWAQFAGVLAGVQIISPGAMA